MIDSAWLGGVIGAAIAAGMAAWQSRKLGGKTDDQTEMLKELVHDVRNVRNTQGGLVSMVGETQGDVREIRDSQDGLRDSQDGLHVEVAGLKATVQAHGHRLGRIETQVFKEGSE